jgi:hypothetical protein
MVKLVISEQDMVMPRVARLPRELAALGDRTSEFE